jgi:hypothetical protein
MFERDPSSPPNPPRAALVAVREPRPQHHPGPLDTLTAARAPIPEPERRRIHAAACAITTLALLDALESPAPSGATAQAVRSFCTGADPHRLGVLLEVVGAREAHAVLEGLARGGLIAPEVAQIAHARIDLRPAAA